MSWNSVVCNNQFDVSHSFGMESLMRQLQVAECEGKKKSVAKENAVTSCGTGSRLKTAGGVTTESEILKWIDSRARQGSALLRERCMVIDEAVLARKGKKE